jgi:3-methylfumaryl-CoA hydratase
MRDWQNWVGRTTTQHDRLTPALLDRYRATIDSLDCGDIGPQGIHWALCTPGAATAELGLDGHPERSGSPESFFPPVPLPRRMWASSKVEFIAPITVDAEIERLSTIASVTEKTGSTGSLMFVAVEHETLANGALAVREMQTLVYRDAVAAKPLLSPATKAPDFAEWQFHRTLTPTETLLFRFSAITFNTHRIHYDTPYAINEEGYRGIVVHGPLLSSLLLDLAAQQFGANALYHFAFRAQSPAFANEPLHLVGKRGGNAVTLAALGNDGRICAAAEATIYKN